MDRVADWPPRGTQHFSRKVRGAVPVSVAVSRTIPQRGARVDLQPEPIGDKGHSLTGQWTQVVLC